MKTKRKLTMAAVGLFALVATTDLLMMSSAQAQPPPGPGGPGGPGRPGPRGGGWIGPAIIGGAILGGMAATAPGYARECWYERRRVVDEYGRRYVRRVRVCN